MDYNHIRHDDPEVFASMMRELQRQRDHIELIASENFVSEAVMEAMGSHLTNKYAEGYPGARYYGGCEFVDEVERIAIDRAKKIYGAEHVNVQPHAGSQANVAVYLALLKPGDTILGMSLADGGHLTPGAKAPIPGKKITPPVQVSGKVKPGKILETIDDYDPPLAGEILFVLEDDECFEIEE